MLQCLVCNESVNSKSCISVPIRQYYQCIYCATSEDRKQFNEFNIEQLCTIEKYSTNSSKPKLCGNPGVRAVFKDESICKLCYYCNTDITVICGNQMKKFKIITTLASIVDEFDQRNSNTIKIRIKNKETFISLIESNHEPVGDVYASIVGSAPSGQTPIYIDSPK
jgi:hypothetical protein